jgi:hypothetical protein
VLNKVLNVVSYLFINESMNKRLIVQEPEYRAMEEEGFWVGDIPSWMCSFRDACGPYKLEDTRLQLRQV